MPAPRPLELADRRILALVMAGGEGTRLDVLTDERAKPSLPYGGAYRLIDFPLSNCVHSGISDVWIVEQYELHSLNEYVSNGRPWDLDRTHGGLRLLPPHQGDEEEGWHQGNADAIHRNADLISEFDPDLVLMLSADHVYKLDYREVIRAHLDRKAEVTMVTTEVEREEAGRFGVVESEPGGIVRRFWYKPEDPPTRIVTTEVFVFDARTLLDTVAEIAGREELEDFGDQLLPMLVERGRAYDHRTDGYWRDVGTVDAYWRASMDLLGAQPSLDLDDRSWPILTLGGHRSACFIEAGAVVDDSLVSSGCTVRGEVRRSVLGPGVVVERGARVSDSILFQEATVGPGARVDTAIIDMEVVVEGGGVVGAAPAAGRVGGADDIAVVGRRARIGPKATISPGDRVKPGRKPRK